MVTILDIDDNEKVMNDEELEIFFNKYDIAELEVFSRIFEYIKEKDLLDTKEIATKVYYEKRKNINSNYEISECADFNMQKILNKNDLLSDKEFAFLKALVDDAAFYLSTIREYHYEDIIEDFSEDDYNIDEMFRLEKSMEDEAIKRKLYKR